MYLFASVKMIEETYFSNMTATPALAACLDKAVASLGVCADHTELYRYVTGDLAQEGSSE